MEKTKPHYCMVVHAHYPIGEPRVEREAEALARDGYQVDVLCLRKKGELKTEVIDGINIYRLPMKRHKKSGVVVQLFEYLAFFILVFIHLLRSKTHYHVVHVHNLPDFLVFSAIIPKLRGSKIVLDIHDLMPEFYLSRFRSSYGRPLVFLLKLQERLSTSFAHRVITVSEPWRQSLIERGVAADKCVVVMNVAGARFTQGARKIQNEKSADQDDDFHLFYHGTLAHRYGIDFALQAVAKVRHELPALRFTIHGRGEFLDDLKEICTRLQLNDIVTFSTEYVPTDELPILIASATVGIVPYRRDVFTDGILPTKLMEYVALDVPALAARTTTIEAYFDDEMVEFFTAENVEDMSNGIRHLYHHRERLNQLAEKADEFNQLYNWSKQREELLKLAASLTQGVV